MDEYDTCSQIDNRHIDMYTVMDEQDTYRQIDTKTENRHTHSNGLIGYTKTENRHTHSNG